MARRPRIRDVVWDGWNFKHIVKHDVVRDEVDEVLAGDPVFQDAYKGRLMAIGPTGEGRMLAVVVGEVPGRPGVFYPFSARPASRRERRRFVEIREGEGA